MNQLSQIFSIYWLFYTSETHCNYCTSKFSCFDFKNMCDESDKSQLKITLDYDKSSKSVTHLFIQEHVVGRLYFLKNCSNLTRANLEKNMGLCGNFFHSD